MLCNLRILHPPCSDNPSNLPVLLLCADAKRYLFNAPEGSSRSMFQQKAIPHIKGISNIFLPRVGVIENGGLPGLIMTMGDAGCRQLTIHGPPVMTHYLATCRSYVGRENIRVQVKETPMSIEPSAPSGSKKEDFVIYRDDHITVQALPVLPTGFTTPSQEAFKSQNRPLKRQKSDGVSSSPTRHSISCLDVMFPSNAEKPLCETKEEQDEDKAEREAAQRQQARRERVAANFHNLGPPPLLPFTLSSDNVRTEQGPVLVYVVRGRDVEGKVDAEKASSLGVPNGKLLGTLKKGEDVRIARPKEWATYSAKERASWYTYFRNNANSSLGQRRGKPTPKERRASASSSASDQVNKGIEWSTIETEEVTIKSSDVVGQLQPGFVFAQIYLPSVHYLDSFLQASTQSHFQSMANESHTIVHAVHPDVLLNSRYQDFIHQFKSAHHMIVSRSFLPNRLAFPSSALANLRMGHLDSELFPPPNYSLEPDVKLDDVGLKGENIHLTDLDTNIKLYPRGPPALNDERALNLDHPLDSDKISRLVTFQEIYGRKQVSKEERQADRAVWESYIEQAKALQGETVDSNGNGSMNDWPLKVTTLGTGSASPSQYRNVSGALIHMPGRDAGYILLDAGESTYSQIVRKFGQKGADDVFANLRLVFLSHIHGDHHMGASRILLERAKLDVQRPLFVVAPSFVRKYLEEVNLIQSLGISNDVESNGVIMINSEQLDSKSGVVLDIKAYPDQKTGETDDSLWKEAIKAEATEIMRRQGKTSSTLPLESSLYEARIDERQRTHHLRKHLTKLLHGTEIFTALVDHRVSHCYGIVFRGKEWSGAYSGDTRPCNNLVKAGMGVDFLLHEATMEDDLAVMAREKGHSTSGQAIDIAMQMKVKYVILTHFSQRYAKLPRLTSRSDLGDLKIGIEFDLLTLKMSDLDKMMRYRETLELLFSAGQEEDADVEGGLPKADGETITVPETIPALASNGNGIDEVAMAVDSASISGNPMVDEVKPQSHKGDEEISSKRLFQRQFVKKHEYQYISFEMRPTPSKTKIAETGAPSRLSIAKAIETSLVELNGVVNGSFNWDLLDVKPISSKNVIRVVVKLPSSYVETMRASFSAGLVVRLGEVIFQARYDRTFSALDLAALETDDSQQWFDDAVKQRDQSSIG